MKASPSDSLPPRTRAGRSDKHVFGPVPSRRLGRSLGVDLVPFKICNYDCIYCQLGRTTCKTVERKEWVPMDAVLDELKQKLTSKPDYITLSGSGEPTLHSRLGEIIEHIQAMTAVPVAVLTNGSLLWQKEVREEVALADVVLPSLDAPAAERFEFINRPHPEITFERLVDGLKAFRREFSGKYWLEVMLLDGYTTLPPQIRQLASLVRRIQPDKVQLNTAVRPPAEEYAMAVPPKRLAQLAWMFKPTAEVVAEHRAPRVSAESQASAEGILALLRRRPCTVAGIALGLGMKPNEAVKFLADLEVRGKVWGERHEQEQFYRAATSISGKPSCRRKPRRKLRRQSPP
ncbi:MAG: radical SAM protein [Verrucomicrobia bacterium]|jgi:wyosine [tRNA(Phe)-imidazoG37] synthetase (radical SAM superfamily)|nr:radical SAM protein [Verrucomicrobiota bacterium]